MCTIIKTEIPNLRKTVNTLQGLRPWEHLNNGSAMLSGQLPLLALGS